MVHIGRRNEQTYWTTFIGKVSLSDLLLFVYVDKSFHVVSWQLSSDSRRFNQFALLPVVSLVHSRNKGGLPLPAVALSGIHIPHDIIWQNLTGVSRSKFSWFFDIFYQLLTSWLLAWTSCLSWDHLYC
jgi:hypothetical protein